MNHFISGILKIVLLEGSIALLLLDAAAGDRFEKARARGHGVLAGLMVFAWCNYGVLRWNTDLPMVLTSIPVILFCGFAVGFAFDPKREERLAAFQAWAAEDPARVGRRTSWLSVLLVVTLVVMLGWLPGTLASDPFGFLRASIVWLVLSIFFVVVSARYARRIAAGDRTLPGFVKALLPRVKVLAVVLTVVLSGAWVGGGVAAGKLPLIHQWEQYHFYLGAKYQREVGWFNLYKATVLADRESVNALKDLPTTRDLGTFEQVKLDDALKDAAQVRGRFTDERWADFRADWATMATLWQINWTQIMNDHGNSNSPAWAIFAAPLTRWVPLSAKGQALLGWLDMLLMLGLWLAIWQSFGHRAASVGLLLWAAPPIVFDYLSGSILRWDWLFSIGLAACFLKQKRYGLAGGFFGFSLATKLFPVFFGVALGLRAIFEWRQTKTFRADYVHFARSAALVGAITVAVSTAMFGVDAWKEYAQRIQVAQTEKFYAIQYSLKTVYLQHAAGTLKDWSQTIFPTDLKQRQDAVDIKDYGFGFLLARLFFTALIAVLIRRADDVEAFVLGPLLVFTWLTVNMYYWNMLGLLALGLVLRVQRPNQRPAFALLIGLHVIFMVQYLYQHLNRALTEGYAVAWMLCVLLVATAVWEHRTTRAELATQA